MKLHFTKIGEGKPLIVLHGLFGISDNWATVAKVLSTHFTLYLVDQRNHGRSPQSEEFNYQLMSDDLQEFIIEHKLNKPHILGHSMGGKTAMNFAVQHPELLEKLIVVDIAPKFYPVHHSTIIAGLKSLDLSNITSRNDADDQLSKYIPQFDTRQFLMKNLFRNTGGQFAWRMNLNSIAENIELIGYGLEDSAVYNGKTLFIRGEKSDYIQDDDYTLITKHFPNSKVLTIHNAGHWVHAEQPKLMIDAVLEFLN